MDELGVLLMGTSRGVYWSGSRLAIKQARALAPDKTVDPSQFLNFRVS